MDANEKWMREAWKAVAEMVHAQENYFMMPGDKNRLKLAKVKEAKVKDILKLLTKAGLIEPVGQETTTQSTIF